MALMISALVRPHALPSGTAPAGTTRSFSLAIYGNPASLDPALANHPAERAVTDNVFQALLNVSSVGQVIPGLARTVTVNKNTVAITLTRAATVNGQPLTAAMVAQALARPLWPVVGSALARQLLSPVGGASAVIAGRTRVLSGVATAGRRRLTIQLTGGNFTAFLHGLANPALSIVPVRDQIQGGQNWQLTNLIGTGGWKLAQWTPGDHLVFTRVGSRQLGAGTPSEIELVEYPKPREAWLSVVNGLLDAAPVSPLAVHELKARWLVDLRVFNQPGTVSLYYRRSATRISAYRRLSIASWVADAFSTKARAMARAWPRGMPNNRPMTIWVNTSNPMAVALARALSARQPLVSVRLTTARRLTKLAGGGRIDAYIGDNSRFSRSLAVTLVRPSVFWLESPRVKTSALFPDGQLKWSSVRLKG